MNETAIDSAVAYNPSLYQEFKWKLQTLGYMRDQYLTSFAMKIIRWVTRDSNYIKHANREFDAIYKDLPKEELDGPNTWIRENIIDLLAVLGTQGHSGGSIGYALSRFTQLAKFKALSPIIDVPETWGECYHVGPEEQQNFQCRRMSSVFKEVSKDGTIRYTDIDSVVYQEEGTDYYFTRGSTDDTVITMPYIPPEKARVIIVPKEAE